jgi:hypothetical protein
LRREAVARRIVEQALDLGVRPERVADSLLAFYEGQHVARAALELEPASLPALTLAGCLAEALREDDVCLGYYRKAVEISPDPMTRWCYVGGSAGGRRCPG